MSDWEKWCAWEPDAPMSDYWELENDQKEHWPASDAASKPATSHLSSEKVCAVSSGQSDWQCDLGRTVNEHSWQVPLSLVVFRESLFSANLATRHSRLTMKEKTKKEETVLPEPSADAPIGLSGESGASRATAAVAASAIAMPKFVSSSI